MKSVYSVFADRLEYDPIELWMDSRGEYVLYGRIAFWPDAERRLRNWLCLNREWVVDGRVERYAGPVAIVVDGAEAESGITLAELGRDHLLLEFDTDAATQIEDDRVLVEFDLADAEFATLRTSLTEMFYGLGVLRLQDAARDAVTDGSA